jgi:nucleoside-diphosphate-sugar epimerase
VIVGDGMMARAFAAYRDDPDVLVFASGVSNSLETSPQAFEREKLLLQATRAQNRNRLLVYFGTCSVDDPDRRASPYVLHKLEMEALLAGSDGPWQVFRLPLAIGPGHRGPTLAQYLHDRISRGESFEVWSGATRYPVDVADIFRIVQRLLAERPLANRVVNVALRPYSVLDFVHAMEKIVGRPARYTVVQKGSGYPIPCPEVEAIADELGLPRHAGYLEDTLRCHFGRAAGD